MAAVAHSPEFAKKVGIKQSVGQEFMAADKGKKFGAGGRADLQKINKPTTSHGKSTLFKGGGMAKDKLKSMFKGKETYAEELKEAKAIKSGKITPQEYAKGEKMEGHKAGGSIKEARMMPAKMEKIPQGNRKFGEHVDQKRGHTRGMNMGDSGPTIGIQGGGMCGGGKVKKMAKGGTASARADGIATKGKTRGKFC